MALCPRCGQQLIEDKGFVRCPNDKCFACTIQAARALGLVEESEEENE
jgi:hypothetical protein